MLIGNNDESLGGLWNARSSVRNMLNAFFRLFPLHYIERVQQVLAEILVDNGIFKTFQFLQIKYWQKMLRSTRIEQPSFSHLSSNKNFNFLRKGG